MRVYDHQKTCSAGCCVAQTVILATQEEEIRRIADLKPVQKTHLEKTHHKERAGEVAQVVEFLPSKHEA
jgi:hypothetical protein